MNILLKTFLVCTSLLFLSACANTGTTVLNSFSKTGDYTTTKNIAYGSFPQNKLDVYRPSSSSGSSIKNDHPVVVFYYGGCWGECSDLNKSDYLFVAQSFASRGFVTIIADTRHYPEVNFGSLMSDASNVIVWTTQNISKYGGNPKNITIIGHSSGAHIASMLALNPRYLNSEIRVNLKGFVGLAGAYDFLPLDEAYQRVLFDPQNNYASSQPINYISPQSPPLLLLHGRKDDTVKKENSLSLARKAKNLGVKHQLIIYPSHGHIGILTALSRALNGRSSVLSDTLKFIRSQ